MEKLKPCPFCGAEAKPREYSDYAKRVAKASKMPLVPMVQCTGCGAMVSFDPEHDHWPTYAQQAANEYWNRRAERTCTLEQVEGWTGGTSYAVKCSSCGKMSDSSEFDFEYCPQCGAMVVG